MTNQSEPLVERGHAAGDALEAWNWRLRERSPGLLVVECDLPEALKNPQGQLFGGFTPTYVDLVSIFTAHTFHELAESERPWMTTINMRCDYFEPILGPTFIVRGESLTRRGRTHLISTKFILPDETLAAHALTTLRELPAESL